MKKGLTILAVTLLTFVLVGCGKSEKKLSCSMDYSSKAGMPSGIKMIMGADINFTKSDKISDMTVSVTFELNDTYKSQIDTLVESMDSTYKNQYKGEHFKVTTEKVSDSSFTTKIYMDYKNMTEDEKKAANVANSKASESYSVNKKDLESQGFTCK
jgi:hypothetical protein